MSDTSIQSVLMLKVGALRCALPLSCVVEALRPLPLRPLAGMAAFVSGASVIRGQAVPVVDLAALLGAASPAAARFVVVRAGERRVALAVESVIGVTELADEALEGVPPLLSQAQGQTVSALGVLDHDLLLVLQAARLVPDEVWPLLAGSGKL